MPMPAPNFSYFFPRSQGPVVCLDLRRERFARRKANYSTEQSPGKITRSKLAGTIMFKYVPRQLDTITERLFRENVANVILDRSYA